MTAARGGDGIGGRQEIDRGQGSTRALAEETWSAAHLAWRPSPSWLIPAIPTVRSAARGIAAFDDAPDRCGGVAHVHGLAVDMEAARDGFRCMLRRSAG